VSPTTRRALNWGIPVLVLLGMIGFFLQGADRPANPSFRPGAVASPPTTASAREVIDGFGEIVFRVDSTGALFGSGGSVTGARCALLAATAKQQNQGLMNRTDLGGYDGMLFRFDGDTSVGFYMKDTLIPLSIAWFDADGRFVSATDMPPCETSECPTFAPGRQYRYALEVPEGNLPGLSIGPGTRIILGEEHC